MREIGRDTGVLDCENAQVPPADFKILNYFSTVVSDANYTYLCEHQTLQTELFGRATSKESKKKSCREGIE